jgi:class 3 adenylate cyclase
MERITGFARLGRDRIAYEVVGTGGIAIRGADVGGMAVHLVTRIMAPAGPGEILVSRTVKDLVARSDLTFEDRGTHRLKGIEGDWPLLAVRIPG